MTRMKVLRTSRSIRKGFCEEAVSKAMAGVRDCFFVDVDDGFIADCA